MVLIKNSILIIITAVCLVNCGSGASSNTKINTTYLAKPSGPYGVGFKDYHYVNTSVCPDPNYVPNVNESDFSSGNQGDSGTNFCHEIMVRIYYPTDFPVISPITPYYPPRVQGWQSDLTGGPGITESQIQALPSTLLSWTLQEIPIANNKFPVILFSPGFNAPAQDYEDYITNLVSYGYIVLGINSVFVNGQIQLPAGVIVSTNKKQSHSTVLQIDDLQFMYHEINNSSNSDDLIFSSMDLSHIGAYGHSDGAYSIVQVANQNPNWFQALSLMDEGVSLKDIPNYLKPITDPVLYLTSSYIYNEQANAGIPTQPLIKSTSYHAIIAPNLQDVDYSYHANFADETTLQYNPAISIWMAGIKQYLGVAIVGTINGYTMVQYVSNDYVIPFFNTFLKNKPNIVFNTTNCIPLSPNTLFTCGQ